MGTRPPGDHGPRAGVRMTLSDPAPVFSTLSWYCLVMVSVWYVARTSNFFHLSSLLFGMPMGNL